MKSSVGRRKGCACGGFYHLLLPEGQSLCPPRTAMQAGLDAVVVTDHNTGTFVDPLKKALTCISDECPDWYRPLVIFPGVEITVADAGARFHVLAVLDPASGTDSVTAILGKCGIINNFGDDENCHTGTSVVEVVKTIAESGGIPILAHVDAERGVLHARQQFLSATLVA